MGFAASEIHVRKKETISMGSWINLKNDKRLENPRQAFQLNIY